MDPVGLHLPRGGGARLLWVCDCNLRSCREARGRGRPEAPALGSLVVVLVVPARGRWPMAGGRSSDAHQPRAVAAVIGQQVREDALRRH